MKCLKYMNDKNWKINKQSDFYKRKITSEYTWNDLRGMRGDQVRRMKRLLLSTTDTPPFWDTVDVKQDLEANYRYANHDVSATSVAEAAEVDGMLISFPHNEYHDKELSVEKKWN